VFRGKACDRMGDFLDDFAIESLRMNLSAKRSYPAATSSLLLKSAD